MRSIVSAAVAVVLATQLAACGGGGGGGGGSSTTPPNSGSPQTPTPPAAKKLKLTLSGAVTDEPIANAEVTATVGDETFSVTADANGVYSLDIEIDEDNKDEFITLSARGVGDQSFVEFVSLAGSFQALAAQAGSDGLLSSSENFATQITNVSTAQAIFLQEANGGPIVSDALLQTLAGRINAQDVLDLAAAIKLAVDDAPNNPLPTGATSILELASEPTARQSFINTVYTNNPEAFAAAQVAIAKDPDLSQNDGTLQRYLENEGFTTAMLSTDALFSFNYIGRIRHFDLYAEGEGYESSQTYNQKFSWEVDGSTIRIVYEQPVVTESFDTVNCNGVHGQIRGVYTTEGAEITFLNARTVAITETNSVQYPTCPSLDSQRTSTVARTILSMDNMQVIDSEALKGNAQTIYVWDSKQQKVLADVAEFNADGTGRALITGQDFTWEMNADGGEDEVGKIIQAEFDGFTAEYLQMRKVDDLASDIFWELRVGPVPNEVVLMGAGAAIFADPEYAAVFTAEDVAGRFYQFGKGDETSGDPRLSGFRLRFDPNFAGSEENDYIDDNDTVRLTDHRSDPTFGFRWSIEEGPVGVEVVVRKTFHVVGKTYNCEVGSANCIVWDERRIIPIVSNEGRIYWIEVRRSAGSGVVGPDTPVTHLVRFYDKEDLGPAPGVTKPKVGANVTLQRQLLDGAAKH